MEPTTLRTPATAAAPPAAAPPAPAAAAGPRTPRLDLSRLERPRQLDEVRLEDVTIDGICGVY